MGELSHFFPLTVFKATLGLGEAYRNALYDRIMLDVRSTNPDPTERYAWTGDVNGFEFLHRDELFAELFHKTHREVLNYLDMMGVDKDILDLYFTRSWAAVSSARQDIHPHQHLQSHLSVVYYLRAPERSGNLVLTPLPRNNQNEFIPGLLERQNFELGVLTASLALTPAVTVEVENDTLLIFPSKTRHGTERNESGQERVSIASDILAVLKHPHGREFMLPPVDMWKNFG